MNYQQFLASKKRRFHTCGVSTDELSTVLFDFQKTVTNFALKNGRAALFLDTGLGKTACQLEWCRHVPGKKLILAPLAVAAQTTRWAKEMMGLDIYHSRDGSIGHDITIANYERLHLFDVSDFDGVVLDESSILKAMMGATRNQLCEAFKQTPYRLACTATPAPNDFTELGNHAEFLGVMNYTEMLSTWFLNDSSDTGTWRLKRHAETDFWDWVSSWAACVEKPSDVGGDDAPFELPPLKIQEHRVETEYESGREEGTLFRVANLSATSLHAEKRASAETRVAKVAELTEGHDFNLIWCETNQESEALADAIPDSVEVKGSDSIERKEEMLDGFSQGKIRNMITKPSLAGFGLNWQHCNHVIFASVSYSYEQFYQAVRRSWRFGQKREVTADVVMSEAEVPIWNAVLRKGQSHSHMKTKMRNIHLINGEQKEIQVTYNPTQKGTLPLWLNPKN